MFDLATVSSSCLVPEVPETKKTRHRTSRACDACRKTKIRCIILLSDGSASCETCRQASRPCTFSSAGVRREKPPAKRDITQLNSRIKSLEKVLGILAPEIDLSILPRSAKQAHAIIDSRSRPDCRHPKTPTKILASSDATRVAQSNQAHNLMSQSHTNSLDPSKGHDDTANNWKRDDDLCKSPGLTYLMTDDACSVFERCTQLHHLRHAANDQFYPPNDLAESLIELYFQCVHPHECILHKGEFLRHYSQGVAQQDYSFRALCYAVFAAASRFSSDSRVTSPKEGTIAERQTAGALYGAASGFFITPMTLPCTLFDLQAMAVLSYFLIGSCSPMTAWFSVQLFLRRAQDVEAHLESSSRWSTTILKDQLRKRAYWYLYGRDVQLCISLGRASWVRQSATIDHPLLVDDETLSRLCQDHVGQIPSKVFENLECSQSRMSTGSGWIANKACYTLRTKFGAQLKMLWSIKVVPESQAWDWDQSLVKQMSQAIDDHIQNEIPIGARWNPHATNEADLVLTSRLRCLASYFQITTHRHLVPSDPLEIMMCLAASRTLLEVLDNLRCRGLLELTATYTPYFITPAALTFLYAACTENNLLSITERETSWADLHRCSNILGALARTTFQADKLQASLSRLVKMCIDEQLFPGLATSNSPESRRDILSVNPALIIGDPITPKVHNESLPQLDVQMTSVGTTVKHLEVLSSPSQPELFNTPVPKLDASFFQFPGKGFQSSSALFATPEWLAVLESVPRPSAHELNNFLAPS
ncbi:fungal-specific transcription factor domain-containing protein, partial [Melampsora americana]